MYMQPMIEALPSNPAIYVLTDGRGNLVAVGRPDVIEVLLSMSNRCIDPAIHRRSRNERAGNETANCFETTMAVLEGHTAHNIN